MESRRWIKLIIYKMKKKILEKLLIIGLGSMGKKYLDILHKNWPEIKIAVLTSNSKYIYENYSHNINIFCNLKSAINWNPNAAIVASPATFHIDQAISLSKAGIPTLIEKPIGSIKDSQNELREISYYSSKNIILMGYVLRHSPCANYLKKMLSENRIGNLIEADFYCASWLPSWREGVDYRKTVSAKSSLGGGVLLEMSHEIDLAFWFLDDLEIKYVYKNNSGALEIDQELEDRALIIAKNKKNVFVTIRLNYCTNPTRRKIIIRGEEGELCWDIVKNEVIFSKNNSQKIFKSNVTIKDLYKIQLEHFFSCIRDLKPPICNIDDGLKVLNLIIDTKKISN